MLKKVIEQVFRRFARRSDSSLVLLHSVASLADLIRAML